MNCDLFEKQNFQTWEILSITNKNNQKLYGFYLDEYNYSQGTFVFLNSATNQREEIVVADMQKIERVYKKEPDN